MIKKLKITEDILKVMPILLIEPKGDDELVINRKHLYNVGFSAMEDIAMAIGIYDRRIKGTEEDSDGVAFSDEDTERILSIHNFIKENLFYLESLIHQYIIKGGIKVGTYKCKDNELIWQYEEG